MSRACFWGQAWGIPLFFLLPVLLHAAGGARPWSAQELFDQADLVVVAHPGLSHDTGTTARPDLLDVVDVETPLTIQAVFKGRPPSGPIAFHHHRLGPGWKTVVDGPNVASFGKEGSSGPLLFFLKREPDGRYAAVSGFAGESFSIRDFGWPR